MRFYKNGFIIAAFLGVGILPFAIVSKHGQKPTVERMVVKSIPEENVYYCSGAYARRYHRYRNCRGLCSCNGVIKELPRREAERLGRTPCKVCY